METGERDYGSLIGYGRLVTGWKYGTEGEGRDREIRREIVEVDIRGREKYARIFDKRGIAEGVIERKGCMEKKLKERRGGVLAKRC